jgi:hypothetical protein
MSTEPGQYTPTLLWQYRLAGYLPGTLYIPPQGFAGGSHLMLTPNIMHVEERDNRKSDSNLSVGRSAICDS